MGGGLSFGGGAYISGGYTYPLSASQNVYFTIPLKNTWLSRVGVPSNHCVGFQTPHHLPGLNAKSGLGAMQPPTMAILQIGVRKITHNSRSLGPTSKSNPIMPQNGMCSQGWGFRFRQTKKEASIRLTDFNGSTSRSLEMLFYRNWELRKDRPG